MPLYDYHCTACGQHFEALVRAGQTPVCTRCGSAALDKQISAPVAPGQSRKIIASARRQAAREGHFSNFSKAEQSRLVK
jgi:putative FmdB family regulatory protein